MRVVDVPPPVIGPTEVLVRTAASVISPGTERAVTELARSGLVAKARSRPDLVRQVVRKAQTDGLARAARAVRDRLDEDIALGYSAAGIALEVGEHVAGISPGQVVATGGAGRANHAELQAVPGLMCTPVPDGVIPDDAAFATVASIALHGLRLASPGPGSKVVVVGLGLMGQLAVRLAQATGCDVAGIDVADFPVEQARASGALGLLESGADTTKAILDWSRGRGADAVMLTAADPSSRAVARTPELCRDRANVVVIGDVGLELERRPFYEKELTLQVARSYGPGRYDRSYEDWAVDYPPGQVRWTEGRNLEAVVDLVSRGRLRVSDLVTHRFPLARALDAYELIEKRPEPYLGVMLTYPDSPPVRDRTVRLRPAAVGGTGVGLVGAGAFATGVLVPAFQRAGFDRFVSVASASGLSARRLAERAGFEKAVSGAEAVIDDPDVDVVVIATPHDTHAGLAARALRAGKHVFCEKPLALTMEELDNVEAAWTDSGKVLFVGFNRRWSPAIQRLREHLSPGSSPLVITYRVNAGPVPAGHWNHDRRQGGRLIGEVCHFIDTCSAITNEDAEDVSAMGSGHSELVLADDLLVSLRYPSGSLASIAYAGGGHRATAKERIEVLGRGHTGVVNDFRDVVLDGRRETLGSQDKGHQALVAGFQQALGGTGPKAEGEAISSSRTTLLAAQRLSAITAASGQGLAGLHEQEPPEPVAQ